MDEKPHPLSHTSNSWSLVGVVWGHCGSTPWGSTSSLLSLFLVCGCKCDQPALCSSACFSWLSSRLPHIRTLFPWNHKPKETLSSLSCFSSVRYITTTERALVMNKWSSKTEKQPKEKFRDPTQLREIHLDWVATLWQACGDRCWDSFSPLTLSLDLQVWASRNFVT